ncbi:MAG: hypothetical protein R3321_00470 [Nitrososphaeraceae archaeon]|nr:hypothetical protein [Nitrososphaeraceae archaeon]
MNEEVYYDTPVFFCWKCSKTSRNAMITTYKGFMMCKKCFTRVRNEDIAEEEAMLRW